MLLQYSLLGKEFADHVSCSFALCVQTMQELKISYGADVAMILSPACSCRTTIRLLRILTKFDFATPFVSISTVNAVSDLHSDGL